MQDKLLATAPAPHYFLSGVMLTHCLMNYSRGERNDRKLKGKKNKHENRRRHLSGERRACVSPSPLGSVLMENPGAEQTPVSTWMAF